MSNLLEWPLSFFLRSEEEYEALVQRRLKQLAEWRRRLGGVAAQSTRETLQRCEELIVANHDVAGGLRKLVVRCRALCPQDAWELTAQTTKWLAQLGDAPEMTQARGRALWMKTRVQAGETDKTLEEALRESYPKITNTELEDTAAALTTLPRDEGNYGQLIQLALLQAMPIPLMRGMFYVGILECHGDSLKRQEMRKALEDTLAELITDHLSKTIPSAGILVALIKLFLAWMDSAIEPDAIRGTVELTRFLDGYVLLLEGWHNSASGFFERLAQELSMIEVR